MTTITLYVRGLTARAEVNGPIPAGTTGITVTIDADETWEGKAKSLICMTSAGKRLIPVAGSESELPHEILRKGYILYMAMEGLDSDTGNPIYTSWASCGRVDASAEGSHDTTPPTPSEIQQLLMIAFRAHERADEAANNAANAARSAADSATFAETAWNDADVAMNAATDAQSAAEAAKLQADRAAEKANAVHQAAERGDFDGEDGHSPYIGANGNWFEWSDLAGDYIDTGVKAGGGGDVPDLTGYAKKEWVQEQGYAKESSLKAVAKSGNYRDLEDTPEIPEAVTDAHINALIDSKLGAIEPLADAILEVL